MRGMLLAALTLVACERERSAADECNAASKVIVDVFQAPDANPPGDSLARLRARCVSDHWTPSAVACFQRVRSREAAVTCDYKQLTQEQADLLRPVLDSIDPLADEAINAIKGFWDRACACTNPECASAVGRDIGAWSEEFGRRRPSSDSIPPRRRDQLKAMMEQIGKCMQRANGDAPAP